MMNESVKWWEGYGVGTLYFMFLLVWEGETVFRVFSTTVKSHGIVLPTLLLNRLQLSFF